MERLDGEQFASESAGTLSAEEQALRTNRAIYDKLDLLAERIEALAYFENLTYQEFGENMPGFKRVMPLVGQSVVDICHALVRRFTSFMPRSTIDLIGRCEKEGLVPAYLIKKLAAHLVLIDSGYDDLDQVETKLVYKGLPNATRVFQYFLNHSRDYLGQFRPK